MSNQQRRTRKGHMPKLPIPAGKAHQKLSQAVICGDHELASWIDRAVLSGQVTGPAEQVAELRQRLDRVMEPHS